MRYLLFMQNKRRTGEIIKLRTGDESYSAYVPKPLPPVPSLGLEPLYPLLDEANLALGRLDGMSTLIPDASLFLYMYVRKEAVLSSQIEGTQSSLSDLLTYELNDLPGAPVNDVEEVSNYVAAMNHALRRLKELPLSLRLIREMHGILLSRGRGQRLNPGEFRTSQNWIGGTRPGNAAYVPPPPDRLLECLGDFEKFLHDRRHRLPVLVKAALAHVQFESIHPFLDGNGRLGRLLIPLILCVDGALRSPLLYLSLYFKTHRKLYYDHLTLVRETGDWEEWIAFFLKGVIETANQATETAQKITRLFKADDEKIKRLGKVSGSVLRLHAYLQKQPVSDTGNAVKGSGLTLPTVIRAFEELEGLGMVRETTGRERKRLYAYVAYLDLLSQGTEPFKD
jgi:Fic family protein